MLKGVINPKKPDLLITNITSSIRKIYDDDSKTDEIINQIYNNIL